MMFYFMTILFFFRSKHNNLNKIFFFRKIFFPLKATELQFAEQIAVIITLNAREVSTMEIHRIILNKKNIFFFFLCILIHHMLWMIKNNPNKICLMRMYTIHDDEKLQYTVMPIISSKATVIIVMMDEE